jgi:hypothetical protein
MRSERPTSSAGGAAPRNTWPGLPGRGTDGDGDEGRTVHRNIRKVKQQQSRKHAIDVADRINLGVHVNINQRDDHFRGPPLRA